MQRVVAALRHVKVEPIDCNMALRVPVRLRDGLICMFARWLGEGISIQK